MMTRKGYKILVAHLAERYVTFSQVSYLSAVRAMSEALKEDNPRFESDRFIEAFLREVERLNDPSEMESEREKK